ncbi:MAG: hypothetical protein ACRENE_31475 [Polyangiaceae bacterium]
MSRSVALRAEMVAMAIRSVTRRLERALDWYMAHRQSSRGWAEVWGVVRASALARLGRPLLAAYLLLALFGVTVILGSIALMRFE